jgi:hypothetical protein
MKLIGAMLAYLVIALLLGWGILLAVHGKPWLLVVGSLAFLIAFVRFGCLPKSTH